MFNLIGHLDREASAYRSIVFAKPLPVEIKSLGPSSWKRFKEKQFGEFPEYESQECCYLEHEQSPGLYVVMNRDTGGLLLYIINDKEHNYEFEGFERLELTKKYTDIQDRLNIIEGNVLNGQLCDAEPADWCWFCGFKYLCIKKTKAIVVVKDKMLDRYADQYKRAHRQIESLETQKKEAVNYMIQYAQTNLVDQFRPNGVAFSYRGMVSNTTLDKEALKRKLNGLVMTDKTGKVVTYTDFYDEVHKKGTPFPGYSIKILEK
jgi:hypothetical protein